MSHSPPSAPKAEILVEPDDVPTGMLTRVAIALTVVVIVCIFGAVKLFDSTLADELKRKGYTETSGPIPSASPR